MKVATGHGDAGGCAGGWGGTAGGIGYIGAMGTHGIIGTGAGGGRMGFNSPVRIRALAAR